jgi:hypothetical protein
MKEKINKVTDEDKLGAFPLKYNGIFTTHCRCVCSEHIQISHFPPSQDHHSTVVNVKTCVVHVMWRRPIMTTNVIKNVA